MQNNETEFTQTSKGLNYRQQQKKINLKIVHIMSHFHQSDFKKMGQFDSNHQHPSGKK